MAETQFHQYIIMKPQRKHNKDVSVKVKEELYYEKNSDDSSLYITFFNAA